jgi:hypothetical protein
MMKSVSNPWMKRRRRVLGLPVGCVFMEGASSLRAVCQMDEIGPIEAGTIASQVPQQGDQGAGGEDADGRRGNPGDESNAHTASQGDDRVEDEGQHDPSCQHGEDYGSGVATIHASDAFLYPVL